jgi:hypothetical protein
MTKEQIQTVLESVRFWPQEDRRNLPSLPARLKRAAGVSTSWDDNERVEEALEQAQRGEFVPDDEMDAFWKRIAVL